MHEFPIALRSNTPPLDESWRGAGAHDQRLHRIVKTTLVLALVVTGLTGVLSWRSARAASENADWVGHTYDVMAKIGVTSSHVVEMQTDARGFSLGGPQILLNRYQEKRVEVGSDLDVLQRVTQDNLSQQQRIDTLLRPQVVAMMQFDANAVTQRQSGARIPGEREILAGETLMDQIRSTIAGMQAEESRLLIDRERRTADARRLTSFITSVGVLFGTVSLMLAGYAIQRGINASVGVRTQLDAATARMEGIIGSAMDAIITVDDQQRILLFNSAAEKMFRRTATDTLGQPLECLIPKRFHGSHAGHIRRFGETGSTSRAMGTLGSLWGVRADGEEFQIEASISQTVASGKKLFTVILRDVTERALGEEALRSSEQRIRTLLDSTEEAIFGEDTEGNCMFCNSATARLLGFDSPEELMRRNMHETMHHAKPDGTPLPREECAILQAIRGGSNYHADSMVFWRKDGTYFPAECWAHPLFEKEKITGSVITFLDISERRQAEAALRENARLLDLAQVMVRDMESRIVLWNAGSEKLYGFSRQEAMGKVSHALLKTEFPEPIDVIEKKLTQAGWWEGELVHHKKDGTRLIVASVWALHRDPQGCPVSILEANTDITQSKANEREIRRLNNELEDRVQQRTAQFQAANKELEAFTYSVSHDLRAPLRHISGFSKMLAEEFGPTLPPDARRYVERIQEGTRRMGLLVDDLLNLGRVGRQELSVQATGLKSIVNDVISDLATECDGRKVEWKVGALPFVDCDPGLMRQVFQNLLSNALKFTRTRETATIEIGQKNENNPPLIFVSDNGVGFSMKYAEKLFGVFQRLHRQEDFEGTGVGLATVQRIIQKHGGRIWAEAELDKGATFYFTIVTADQAETSLKTAVAGGKA